MVLADGAWSHPTRATLANRKIVSIQRGARLLLRNLDISTSQQSLFSVLGTGEITNNHMLFSPHSIT